MKQYQFIYLNNNDLSQKFLEIQKAGFKEIIFYLTWTHESEKQLDEVVMQIEKAFPSANYYGVEGSGSISNGKFALGVNVTCYAFESRDSKTELVWVEKDTKMASLDDLWKYCNKQKGIRAIEMIPSVTYVDLLKIDDNVPDVNPDIVIFGGASVNYDTASMEANVIAKGHPKTMNGMPVILYYGKTLVFSSNDILGWKGLGRLMEVTKSDGKVIQEIDNAPAYSVYENYLNLSFEDRDTLVFPLILEEDGNEFIRTPQLINSDRSMNMFVAVPTGSQVRIAYGDKNTIIKSINDKSQDIKVFNPDILKAYSCAARRLYWGDNEVSKETVPLQKIAPVAGFYTGGEILRFGNKLKVLNSTLAIIGIREGKGPKSNGVAVEKIEDKSLLSRLTYFTSKIVEEEQAQRSMVDSYQRVLASNFQILYYIDTVNYITTMIRGDDEAKKFAAIFNGCSTEEVFENFHKYYVDNLIHEDDREKVKAVMNASNVVKTLLKQPSMSVNFRVRRNLVDYTYLEMRIYNASQNSGELTAVMLGFKLSDDDLLKSLEAQRRLEEDAIVIGSLSKNFDFLYFIETREDREHDLFHLIRTTEFFTRVPHWGDEMTFTERLELIIETFVIPEEVESFYIATRREVILENLNKNDTYFVNTKFMVDGEVKYYQAQFSAVRDGNKLLGMVFGIRSIQSQMEKELENKKQLQEALAQAEVANKSKTTFLFNMSHDIRTPMNAIKGFTAMAIKYSYDESKVKECLKKIDVAGSQLIVLINQVLEMSRIESGTITIEERPTNIRELFDSVNTIVSSQASSKGLTFNFSSENIRHLNVLADGSRISQIALNVIGNAIKYTPEGGRIDVKIKEVPAHKLGYGSFVLTVADNGIGMSEQYLKDIYTPFSREKNSTVSKIQGTGLGMSIVKNLVDIFGGKIKVKSKQGKGTTFDIALDFKLVKANEVVKKEEEKITVDKDLFIGKKVLLVEDNEMNREIAKDLLMEYGFIVDEADDGDVAVRMCEEISKSNVVHYYDFILMDIQMPRMNGYDATKAIRKIPSKQKTRIPIIAMTANAFEEDKQNAFNAGMDAHLAKPFDVQALLETLAKFL